jgi:hypothetical protein
MPRKALVLSELVLSIWSSFGAGPAGTRCFDDNLLLLCEGASIFRNSYDLIVSSVFGENPMEACRFPISLLLLLAPAVARALFVESLPDTA